MTLMVLFAAGSAIGGGVFSPDDHGRYRELVDSLRGLEETLKAHESDMRKRLQVRPPHTRATHAYRCCHHAGLDVGLGLDLGLRCNRVRMLG